MSARSREVHFFNDGKSVVIRNMGCPNGNEKKSDTNDELARIQKENHILRRQLSRRWSSRSRASISSKIVVAEVLTDDEDEDVDDSFMLLKENSTLHGLRDLLTSNSLRFRLVWIVLLFIAVLLTSNGVYEIYEEYKQRRVVVSYFIQESNVLSIPDIVICPFNRFNRSYLQDWNVSSGLAQYLELSYPSPLIHSFQERAYEETIQNLDEYDYELELLLARIGNMTYTQFLKAASLGCDAFFMETERCSNITEIMTSAGKCFRLNGVDQWTGGFGYGERIVLKLPQHLYNPGSNQMLNDGIIVKLATRGKGIDNDLTFVPAGVHAIIPLTATRYEFMNDPPRYECIVDEDGSYSQVWCYEVCLTTAAEDICNCSVAAATRPRKPRICTTKMLYHCFMVNLFTPNHTTVSEHCKSKCKAPCNYWHYSKAVSYATFPGPAAKYFVANQSEWEELKSTIVLEVYFPVLDYTMIKHVVAMPFQSVIAQIGGQLSLWAGGSLISICQLVIYLTRWCCKSGRRKLRKRLRNKQTKDKKSKKSDNNNVFDKESIDRLGTPPVNMTSSSDWITSPNDDKCPSSKI